MEYVQFRNGDEIGLRVLAGQGCGDLGSADMPKQTRDRSRLLGHELPDLNDTHPRRSLRGQDTDDQPDQQR